MCLYPTLIKNKKYIANKKNGGIVPPLPLLYDKENDKVIQDKRVLLVPVGCGKCMECMKKRAREISVRLQEEIRTEKNGVFVTLTFSDDSILELSKDVKNLTGYERDNEIATLGVRRFLERWRKKYKKSVRHWLVTELGHNGTENIHLHGIIWTDNKEDINKIWKYGFTFPKPEDENYVSERTINYITKYITKVDAINKEYKPKILSSAGIGKGYIKRMDARNNVYKKLGLTDETYKTRQRTKLALPIYYRNKLYTEEEREQLWLDKLDKNERWVNGEKVDISQGEEEYYKLLKHYQGVNRRLGYGDNKKNWERKRYEDSRRNLNFKRRIWKAEKKRVESEAPF